MTTKITQATGGPLLVKQLKNEATMIAEFLDVLTKAGKTLTIPLRSGAGQFSACTVEHMTPKDAPRKIYTNSAWVGISFKDVGSGPDFYRTETIECRNAFVVWMKSMLVWLKEKVEQSDQAFKDISTILVPQQICFTSGFRFATVE